MALRIASKAAPKRAQCLINGIQKASTRQLSSSNRILQQEPNTARPDQFDDFFDRPKPREKASRDHYSDTFTQSNGVEKASNYATRHLRPKQKVNLPQQRTPRPKATPEPNPVKIERFGEAHELSPLLLRDLCQCSLCLDSSTRQKHFATVDIPLDIAPKGVRVDETHVHISWSNDVPGMAENHITSIPLPAIDNIIEDGNPVKPRQPLPRSLWDAKTYTEETRDFDYEAYMNDDSTLYAALKQLETHGLLFITNVPESAESVETLAKRIGPLKTTFYGKTWDVRSVPEAKNVAYTSQNLGFHMDLMYMKQPPHLQLLHCIRSSAAGGASLFSDSFRAIENIARRNFADFTTLSRIPATYHYDHADHYYHQRRPVIEQRRFQVGPTWFQDYSDFAMFKTKKKDIEARMPNLTAMDFVDHVAWSPPFQGPFSVSSIDTARYGPPEQFLNSAIRHWHAAAQRFNDLIHLPENVYERMMKPGECVIFDNRRVLHARRAFEVGDAGKERWLRGAYIDKDPFISKLKVMEDERRGAGQDDVPAEVQAEEPAVAVA